MQLAELHVDKLLGNTTDEEMEEEEIEQEAAAAVGTSEQNDVGSGQEVGNVATDS